MTEPNVDDEFDRHETDLEAPEADVLEQRASAHSDREHSDGEHRGRGAMPFEADAADAAEQGHDVGDDEDDYRDS